MGDTLVTVKVEGAEAVAVKLGRMEVGVNVAVAAVVNEAALKVQAQAKRLAPVDTGRLRASIRPTFYRNGLAAEVGTDVEYAPFVEFGTRYQQAQPFLFPAWEAVRPAYMAELAAALKALGKV